METIKVLGIVCSPRKGGNTELLVQEALAGAQEMGAGTELLAIGDKVIKPCDGCRSCDKAGKCHIQDDMQPIYHQLLESHGLIFGTPVYFWSVTGQAKVFIDRMVPLYRMGWLKNKVGSVIAVAGGMGQTDVRNFFYTFFSANQMIVGDFVPGFARDKGQIRRDRYAWVASRELGRKTVAIIQGQLHYPEGWGSLSGLVKEKYGIESSPVLGRFDPWTAPDTAVPLKQARP